VSRAARRLGYRWHLRRLMAKQGLFQTSQLRPLLAERGIALSPSQVYRLVSGTPERLNLSTLVALCDILGCTPADLIEPVAKTPKRRASAAVERDPRPAPADLKPMRARVVREDDQ
jgi:DNA-binding Xre family transcriptional regulator